MRVQSKEYYHVARLTSAQEFIEQSTIGTWLGDTLNYTTIDLYKFCPKIDLGDGGGARHLINALLRMKGVPESQHGQLMDLIRTALIKTNRRYMEAVFERYRQQNCPDLPSRLTCMFLSAKENLSDWYPALGATTPPIYLLEVDGQVHIADHRWLDTDIMTQDMYEDYASSYWQGKQYDPNSKFIPEVLFQGEFRVIAKHDSLQDLETK